MRLKTPGWLLIMFFVAVVSWVVAKQDLNNQRSKLVLSATDSMTVEDRFISLENRVWNLEKNAGLIRPRGIGKTNEQFVNLAGGSVSSSGWTKIPGTEFYFDSSLYGKSIEVSWQGWMEKESTGGVRLYDSTNNRVVDYSEMTTAESGKTSFYSKPLSIWRGQNLYYMEGKSASGAITVSTPRLRVVTK